MHQNYQQIQHHFNKVRMFRNKVINWAKEEAAPYILEKKSYSMQPDEGADLKAGCFGPMMSFSAKMKPTLMNFRFIQTAANNTGFIQRGIEPLHIYQYG